MARSHTRAAHETWPGELEGGGGPRAGARAGRRSSGGSWRSAGRRSSALRWRPAGRWCSAQR
eukprot:11941467-Alexandrium_andersonii.AAC.1